MLGINIIKEQTKICDMLIQEIKSKIFEIKGSKVMLDFDLSRMYETKNRTLKQGVAMLSSVLKSQKAIEVNIAIIRAFVFLRQYALSHGDLTDKLHELEKNIINSLKIFMKQ